MSQSSLPAPAAIKAAAALTGSGESHSWGWVLAVLTHVAWGVYPVLARYLIRVAQVPPMHLSFVGNLIPLACWYTLILRRPVTDASPDMVGVSSAEKEKEQQKGHVVDRVAVVWRTPGVVALVAARVGRSLTNLIAVRLTSAVVVELLTLSTPFFVALIARLTLNEPLPPYGLLSMTLSAVGALMMIVGGHDSPSDGSNEGLSLGVNDLLGIGMSIVSSLFLAWYMVLLKKSSGRNKMPPEHVLVAVTTPLVGLSWLVSVIIDEDEFSAWNAMRPLDWVVFGFFSVGVLVFGNLTMVLAVRKLGASHVSTLLATRLVWALVAAFFMLDERIDSAFQIAGAALVCVTLSFFLWTSTRGSAEARFKKKESPA